MPFDKNTILLAVKKKPFLTIQFSESQWDAIEASPKGVSEFTIARNHENFNDVSAPRLCFLLGDRSMEGVYVGVFLNKTKISTLDTRVKVKHTKKLLPVTKVGFFNLLASDNLSTQIENRLEGYDVRLLTPTLSEKIADKLLEIESCRSILEFVFEQLNRNRRFVSSKALQEDALNMVLKVFGQRHEPRIKSVSTSSDETALDNIVPIIEDRVIEHDARTISGFDLIQSDITGRAIFESRDGRMLEVITANRGRLENVLGVDLIYLNKVKKNVVMVQYKMMDPIRNKEEKVVDWAYRPNNQLADEIQRMKRFIKDGLRGDFEYRFNPDVFYLKFVKRDGSMEDAAVIMPLTHYEAIKDDPSHVGDRGASKISFNNLGGQYLRPSGFIELMKTGYIGSYSNSTDTFQDLINLVLTGNKSILAAIETIEDYGNEGDQNVHNDESYNFPEETGSGEDRSYDDLPF